MTQQMQEAAAAQKLQREQDFRKAIQGSFNTQPLRTGGLTQTGPTSQLGLLGRPEFGGGFADQETVAALRANPNLPTERVFDQNKFMAALAEYNPLEFAKIQASRQTTEKESFRPMTADEKKQYGLPQDSSFQVSSTGKISQIGSGPQAVVTISPGDTALQKFDAEDVRALSSQVTSARKFANTAESINTLLKGKGGGDVVKVGANIAQALGLQSDTASANALAQALQVSSATQVRAAGSGSTSDLEFKSFLQVFPSLGNTEQGRALMAKGLRAFAERDAMIERKARELFRDGKYSAAAIAEYDASLGPVLNPKEFGNISSQSTGGATPQRRDFR